MEEVLFSDTPGKFITSQNCGHQKDHSGCSITSCTADLRPPPSCAHHPWFDDVHGEMICVNCGEVLAAHVPMYNEQGFFEAKTPSSPRTSPDNPPSGQLLRALRLDRLRSWQEQRKLIGIVEISRICAVHTLPDAIRAEAIVYYQKALKSLRFANRWLRLIALVSVFYTARSQAIPLSMEQMLSDRHYTLRLAQRYLFEFIYTLHLTPVIQSPLLYLPAVAAQLSLDGHCTQQIAGLITLYHQKTRIAGISSQGLLAGTIYFYCLKNRTPMSQSRIARCCQVSEITLRHRFKEIRLFYQAQREDPDFPLWE